MALLRQARHRQLITDYGPASPETTEDLKPILYSPDRLPDLARRLERGRGTFVIGHFRAHKYRDFFALDDFATFLREPYARLVSEYNHHLSRGTIDMAFREFLKV